MRLLLASPIAPATVTRLQASHDVTIAEGGDLAPLVKDRQAIIFRSGVDLSADVLDQSSDLELLVRAGSGFDNVDLAYARTRGLRAMRVPGPSAQAVAELTFGLMLAVARKIVEADRAVRQGSWPKHQLGGPLLAGKTLGVVGAGNIGGRVGELGVAWGMRVLGCVEEVHRRAQTAAMAERGIELLTAEQVISEADIVTIHTPLTDATRDWFDRSTLATLRPSAILINTARGGIVDEVALFDALASGRLAGAALDVHQREGEGIIPKLAELPNVVLTPHIGGMALESQTMIGERIEEMLDAYERGRFDEAVLPNELLV